MTSEEHIHKLSQRVIEAPEGSDEFGSAMEELRAPLNAGVARGRAKIAELQSALLRSNA